MITEIPLYVLKIFSGPSSISSRLIGVTSHTTPLSIRRGVGGEASVTSVCRRRSVGSNCAQKCSVNSVCSVREKTPQRFVCVLYHTVVAFFFSQKNTDEQNTRYFTETLSQPISQNLTANRGLTPSPSPNGEGSDHRVTPIYSPILSSPVWVTSHTTPLSIRRGAGGEASRGWG